MKNILINNSFNLITKHKHLSDYEKIKIKYGLEVMYNFLIKTTIIILLALIFKSLMEVVLIFIFYGLLRTFIHGVHGNSNILCWIITLSSYSISIFIIKTFEIIFPIKITICTISLISFILWAPSDTKYRPLLNKKKRMIFKYISIIISLLYSLIIITTEFKYSNCILVALCLSSIAINPISYKLLGLERNNYKTYR